MNDEWQDENFIRNVMENVDQISRMQFGLCQGIVIYFSVILTSDTVGGRGSLPWWQLKW